MAATASLQPCAGLRPVRPLWPTIHSGRRATLAGRGAGALYCMYDEGAACRVWLKSKRQFPHTTPQSASRRHRGETRTNVRDGDDLYAPSGPQRQRSGAGDRIEPSRRSQYGRALAMRLDLGGGGLRLARFRAWEAAREVARGARVACVHRKSRRRPRAAARARGSTARGEKSHNALSTMAQISVFLTWSLNASSPEHLVAGAPETARKYAMYRIV